MSHMINQPPQYPKPNQSTTPNQPQQFWYPQPPQMMYNMSINPTNKISPNQ